MSFKSEGAYTAELQAVLHIAHALRDAAGACHQLGPSPITNSPHSMINTINFPSPRPLLPSLLEADFNREVAAAISKTYQLRAEELRQCIKESVVTTCRGIAELPVAALASSPELLIRKVVFTFTELYLGRLEQWKEEIIQRIKYAPGIPTKVSTSNSPAFNYEYVPLLEHFFEENPFPTHADKMFLANKSNMQYRQIHVWFQNRRSRTKKEGKMLRKKPTYEGSSKPLHRLYERMKDHTVDFHSRVIKSSEAVPSDGTAKTEFARDNASKDTFASTSPPHAFPSLYPPACHYDPFPCKSGPICFTKPEWRRVPDGKRPPSLSTSIDNLIERFSHLNVRDGTHSKGSSRLQLHAATAAITVIPSRAPHPSLIVREYRQPISIVQSHSLVRAPVSCSKAFPSPSPTSKPVTLIPPSAPPNKSKLPEKRKIAPLPQRFPGQMRNTRRDTTPSDCTSTSSSSPRLFSPNSESRSCSFSSVSSLSTPSDAANIQELPLLFGSPCRSPFDSPVHLRDLGDMVTISPPSVS